MRFGASSNVVLRTTFFSEEKSSLRSCPSLSRAQRDHVVLVDWVAFQFVGQVRHSNTTTTRYTEAVAPEGAAAFFAGVRVQTAVVLTCLNRDGSTVLYLQASLLQRDSGWSADTSITWVSQDAQKHGFKEPPADR